MESNMINPPNTSVEVREAETALMKANAFVVDSPESFAQADAECQGLFNLRKKIEAHYAKSEKAAREAKKAAIEAVATLVALKEKDTVPVQQSERVYKVKMNTYQDAEEKKRQVLEAENREKARRLSEDEQVAKAARLEAQGKTDQAEAVMAKPIKVAAVVVPTSTPKAETKISRRYSCKIVDPSAVRRELCNPDQVALNRLAVALKEKFNEPGCELVVTVC